VNGLARFGIFPKSSRRRLNAAEALDLLPLRAPHVRVTEAEGSIVLSVRRRNSRVVRALSWFFTLPENRTFQLDRIGTLVWSLCDGLTPVRAISVKLGEEFGWPTPQAQTAVLQFLSSLSERHLVGFPSADNPEPSR